MRTRMITFLKRALAVLLLAPALTLAADESVKLDRAPVSTDQAALQHGAKLFVNYCLGCHAASYVRYNQLENIGLSEQLIRDNLMFTGDKVGDLMRIPMRRADGTRWFGAAPPDLSVIARSRASGDGSGADWLYTYLRNFYRDHDRPTGWNNVIFENVGMPHALWELQGEQTATVSTAADGSKTVALAITKPGTLQADEYDKAVADLVSFLVWMGEPVAEKRKAIGTAVLIFLAGFFVLALALKKNYWKDIH
ncbi:MAG: cytochrome c1 [Thauera sp.]|nr:cytochrome c1 [Thauera sp.]